jgi:glycosidase
MAPETPHSYRSLVIYEVYPRNHGPNGNFADVEADLERIRGMGVDVLWFMPIHPIGAVARKGRLGSPYSIADYRGINPEYGTLDDFRRLVDKAHALGLKVMIDVVYNHTAHDSVLVREHPEWFHQDAQGRPFTTVPAWSDIIDLRHPHPGLQDYLIDCLVYWARQGVDGFRCDVASIVPLDFWLAARAAVEAVKPGVLWLAESVHASFVEARRAAGLAAWSDGEIYAAFDMTYVYDIHPIWQLAVRGEAPVARYLEMLRFQNAIYPANYIKLRCVENHDQMRIQALAPTPARAVAWTAFEAFNQGAFLIYAGQEAAAVHTPTLFDRDPVDWNGYPLQPLLTRLAHIKKDRAVREGTFTLLAAEPVVQAVWYHPGGSLLGVFDLSAAGPGDIRVTAPDGDYEDLLGGGLLPVRAGSLALTTSACILRCELPRPERAFPAPLLDYYHAPE